MSFNTDEYVDVAERIRLFAAKYPEGSLQSEVEFVNGGVLCQARAYRSPSDERPGIGHAFEPIPGKTSFTRDSETMNAETSAWGRAIVALGFETKKIASADEVRARSGAGTTGGEKAPSPPQATAGSTPAPDNPAAKAQAAQAEAKAARAPDDGGKPSQVLIHFGKNAGKRLGELAPRSLGWYATEWEPGDRPEDRRLKLAAIALKDGDDTSDFDIPF